MVYMSSRPWVGCEWRPSPALMTWMSAATWRAMKCGAPLSLWRTTNMSACIAERLSTVSSRLSPLLCEDTATLRLMTSADRRLAAISNVVRVRVEDSKKTLNTDLPRRSGTFFTLLPTKVFAVSRICHRISAGSPSRVSRWCSCPFLSSCGLAGLSHMSGLPRLQHEGEPAVGAALQVHALRGIRLDARADELRGDRQLAPAPVHEGGELHARRPAVVEQLVQSRPYGAAGVEHVVDQDQLAALDFERDLGALYVALQAA